jgi:hypothetical protein
MHSLNNRPLQRLPVRFKSRGWPRLVYSQPRFTSGITSTLFVPYADRLTPFK